SAQVWCGDVRKQCGACHGCLDSTTKECKPDTVDTCSSAGQVWCSPLTTWRQPKSLVIDYNEWYNGKSWGERPASLLRDWPPIDPTCFTDPFVKASNRWIHLPMAPSSSSAMAASELVASEPTLSDGPVSCNPDPRYIDIPRPGWWGVGNWPPTICKPNLLTV
ncbi:hypothetical protein DYB38_005429, partial [Aphanomyces astaci]